MSQIDLSSYKILIVDDYKTMRRIIRNLVTQLGAKNPDEAEDGESALVKLRQNEFDLVISDWNMEPMTGFDLLRNVRKSGEKFADVVFVMVTAEAKRENVEAASKAGVDNYIVKPFNANQLSERIQQALEKRGIS